jgi:hypothetical protein
LVVVAASTRVTHCGVVSCLKLCVGEWGMGYSAAQYAGYTPNTRLVTKQNPAIAVLVSWYIEMWDCGVVEVPWVESRVSESGDLVLLG